ncbi:MAG: acetate kinase [Mycobacteriaceae bacterium]
MIVLVLNAGSSTIKYEVREQPAATLLAGGIVERIGDTSVPEPVTDHAAALQIILARLADEPSLAGLRIDAVGHRVVHGGERFTAPVLLTDEVVTVIDTLSALAPLHNPAGVAGIRALAEQWPDRPQVVVFDTAFHTTLPERAWRYAVPDDLYRDKALRRYGFHGISYQYVSDAAAAFLGVGAFTGVIAHLGNGASVCAVRAGISVDTSMGLTPLEGLVMGTRSGDLDPGAVLYLQRSGYTVGEVDELFNRRSGLMGLAGESDMRAVQQAADGGDRGARLALEVAAYRLAKYVASYLVAVGGVPVLGFTGGIGENSAPFRAQVVRLLAPLGLRLDDDRNAAGSDERVRTVSAAASAVPVLVVRTDEEAVIAAATERLVGRH